MYYKPYNKPYNPFNDPLNPANPNSLPYRQKMAYWKSEKERKEREWIRQLQEAQERMRRLQEAQNWARRIRGGGISLTQSPTWTPRKFAKSGKVLRSFSKRPITHRARSG